MCRNSGATGNKSSVRGTRGNGDTDTYRFAKDSGLLVSSTLMLETPQGKMAITTNNSDFQDTDGALLARTIEQVTPFATLKIVIDEVSFAPLSDADFTAR